MFVIQLWEAAAPRRVPVHGPRLCKWVQTHILHTTAAAAFAWGKCTLRIAINEERFFFFFFFRRNHWCHLLCLILFPLTQSAYFSHTSDRFVVCPFWRHLPRRVSPDRSGEQTGSLSATSTSAVGVRGEDGLKQGWVCPRSVQEVAGTSFRMCAMYKMSVRMTNKVKNV